MRLNGFTVSLLALSIFMIVSSCAVQEEKAAAPTKPAPVAEAKAPPAERAAPVKSTKTAGDIGLLDLEKNYLILVTKEGKLITADFTDKTPVTKLIPQKAKMSDIGLGQTATVTYVGKGDKKIAESVEFTVKAKKGE